MEFLKWNSSILRITINRVKSQTKVWAKIFANHLSDKGLISKICNKLLQLNNKELGDEENRWEIGCCCSVPHVHLFSTPWIAAIQASLSFTISQSLLKLITSIESVMPYNHFILCHPLLLLPSIFPSIRVFSNESVHRIRWPKYWSFSFRISFSNEHSGPISFRMDWIDLLAVQRTLKSLLQHHSSKASIL